MAAPVRDLPVITASWGGPGVTAGLIAGSVALIGFAFDSWIEVAATVVLILRRAEIRGGEIDEAKERRALRFVAIICARWFWIWPIFRDRLGP